MPRSNSPVKRISKTEAVFEKDKKTSLVQQLPQQPQQPQQPSFLNTMKEGFSFGVGSAIAREVINSLFSDKSVVIGSKDNNQDTKILPNNQQLEFNKCMETHNDKYQCSNFTKKQQDGGENEGED